MINWSFLFIVIRHL